MMFRFLLAFSLIASVGLWATAPAAAQEIKIGYWAGGFSRGFCALLKADHFFERQGLSPEFVPFDNVNGPIKAVLTHSVDAAFAAPVSGTLSLSIDGAPIEIVLATLIAQESFVAVAGSPLKSLADLKGKRIGMSSVGSVSYAIVTTVLAHNYGLRPSDYIAVSGSEDSLLAGLRQGAVDVAFLRAVTLLTTPGGPEMKTIGTGVAEWRKMTESSGAPIFGVAAVHRAFAHEHPEAVVKFVRAMIEATRFGSRDPAATAATLRQALHLDAEKAAAYVRLWPDIYVASLAPDDILTMKEMAAIFHSSGAIQGKVPDSLYATAPYQEAIAQR